MGEGAKRKRWPEFMGLGGIARMGGTYTRMYAFLLEESMRSTTTGFNVLAATVALFSASARATTTTYLTLDTLARGADVVAVGRVLSVTSRWVGEGSQKSIATEVKLRVDETMKGKAQNEIKFGIQGGVVGDIGQVVHGVPSFEVGEAVVVFLHHPFAGSEVLTLHGLEQGKYTVETTSDGKEAFAVPVSAGAQFIDPDTGQPTDARAQTVPLARIRQVVSAAVKAGSRRVHQSGKAK